MRFSSTRFSIRLKLLSSAALVLLPISAFIYFYFPNREEDIALAAIASRTTNMAEFVALGVGRGLHLHDFSDVVSALGWVKEDATLAYVVVVDSAGGPPYASYNPKDLPLDLAVGAPSHRSGYSEELFEVSAPIRFEGRRLGTLFLGVSLAEMHEQITGERRVALAISVVVFLLGAAASHYFAHRITQPLLELRGAAESLSHGNYDVAIPQGGRDEVGDLAEGFGTMVRNLKEGTEQLIRTVDELAAARDAAESSERAKAYFLATMSHEIRTPMNGVMGMLELLGGTELNQRQRRFADTAFRSAEALLDVINSILDFSKIESGHMELHRTDFDLRQAVEDVCEMLAPQAHQKGVDVIVRIAPGLHDIVSGDVMRMRQILVNLLGNAIKFTSAGAIQVRVTPAECADQSHLVRIEVQDSGIGISPEAAAKLFMPFVQADASTTRKFGGTGLGLAITRQLVVLMGGAIGVESTVGVGSTFWFTVALEPRQLDRSATELSDRSLRDRRILVIDDNAVDREVLREQLVAWGAHVDEAEDGRDGLELLRRQPDADFYDVVILDFNMPEMDGAEVARRIRSNPSWTTLPILLLSSVMSSQPHESLAPVNAFLSKPARRRELAESLSLLVNRPASRSAAINPVHARERTQADLAHVSGQFRGMRILLAEDNVVNQQVAVGFLEALGCVVFVADNGQTAVRAATSQEFDLVLMDCMMPEMDGYQATRVIRAHPEPAVSRLPIVALTASALEGERQKCLAAGMSDYLAKPFRLDELTGMLGRWRAVQGHTASVGDAVVAGADADSTNADAAVIDHNAAWSLDLSALESFRTFPGGARILADSIGAYRRTAPTQLDLLSSALATGDRDSLHREAHKLKSSSAMLGLAHLGKVLNQLELQAQHATVADLERLFTEARAVYCVGEQQLSNYLAA